MQRDAKDSTKASYFRYGMEAGLLGPDDAREWAFSVIAERDPPPVGILEIATVHGREQVLDALGAAMDGADLQAAGATLLSHLQVLLEQGLIPLRAAARMAGQVALAESGAWGTVDDVGSSLLQALKGHAR